MLVPKLRFKEFTGEWKISNIGSLAKCIAGATPNTKTKEYWENGTIPWLSSGEVNKKRIYFTNNFITQLGFSKSSTKFLPKNTVVIALAGQGKTRGLVGITELELCTNQSLCGIVTNNIINDEYLYQRLIVEYENLRFISSGDGTRGGLNLKIISDYKISFPLLNEQNEIANFLSLLDKKIELQTKKIEVLKIYKSCQLNQIFISNNLSECFLKDLAVIKKGQQINSDKLLKNGNYYMLNGGITLSGYLNEYNTENNTISISEGGNSCGYVNYNYQNFWSGGHCYTLTPININNEYLYHLLKNSEKLIMKLRIGTGLPNIQKKDLENVKIKRHKDIKIQEAIANAFMSFDLKIKLEADKLSLLKNMKKGLMQNMFV